MAEEDGRRAAEGNEGGIVSCAWGGGGGAAVGAGIGSAEGFELDNEC